MSVKIPQKKLTVCDIIIIAAVALITAFSFVYVLVPSSRSDSAHIITADKSFDVSLDKDDEFVLESNGYIYTVIISDGEIRIADATCPDGICKNTPAVGKNKGTIVCLPGKLIIERNEREGEADDADIIVP